jgi:hypothetical protein
VNRGGEYGCEDVFLVEGALMQRRQNALTFDGAILLRLLKIE